MVFEGGNGCRNRPPSEGGGIRESRFRHKVWQPIRGLVNKSSDRAALPSAEGFPSLAHDQAGTCRLRGEGAREALPDDAHSLGSYGCLHVAGRGGAFGPVHGQEGQRGHPGAVRRGGDARQDGGDDRGPCADAHPPAGPGAAEIQGSRRPRQDADGEACRRRAAYLRGTRGTAGRRPQDRLGGHGAGLRRAGLPGGHPYSSPGEALET